MRVLKEHLSKLYRNIKTDKTNFTTAGLHLLW